MNYAELTNREVELIDGRGQRANNALRCPRTDGELNQQQSIFLNDSLRSISSSVHDDSSQNSISEADSSLEDEALLERRPYPYPNIARLYRVLYDYMRYGLAAFFFVYSFVLLFSSQGQCYNGSGSLKKLPKISSFQSTRVRHV